MQHIVRVWKWIDYRFTPDQPMYRYRKQQSIGQDDFGNAVMVSETPYWH